MKKDDFLRIEEEMKSLPQGGITYKTIKGKAYAYYQWRENNKQHSRRVKDDELEVLSALIQKRKELSYMIKEETSSFSYVTPMMDFRCGVRIGGNLKNFVKSVKNWKKRKCYKNIEDYLYGDYHDRVFILYGLRRTGKTTLIRQIIANMDDEVFKKCAFVHVREGNTIHDVYHDLNVLESQGYQYVFIDEVTLADDFIECSALLSDIYSASGMKIVLSGTDSLGFLIARSDQLYDRTVMVHTTFIPYREFEDVLGISGIDQYIRYGGTMSMSGKLYQLETQIFSNKKNINEYVDSAIATNIQHSLKNYQYEGHFRSLKELYEHGELTSVINRIVEDVNHRFTYDVLTRDFSSHDLKISAKNMRYLHDEGADILDRIDFVNVNERLRKLLDIKNKDEQSVLISEAVRYEIKEYLDLLDLTVDVENRWMSNYNHIEKRTLFTQPGLRYAQAKHLIHSLLADNEFKELSFLSRKFVIERIVNEIKGRMMEDIVLLETMVSNKELDVFRLMFPIGEFDMVVSNEEEGWCEIYEIKHSDKVHPHQYRHLKDDEKCKQVEHRYGTIRGKYVIYRGEEDIVDGIHYINAEKYLKRL